MAGPYSVGAVVRISGTFRDANGAVIDPTTVNLQIKTPAGVITGYTYPSAPIVKDSVGVYHADVSMPTAGVWSWRWYSTGTGQAATEGTFVVNASNFS